MSSLVALQPGEIKPALPAARLTPVMANNTQDLTAQAGEVESADSRHQCLMDDSDLRERSDNEQDADGEPDHRNDNSSNEDGGPTRKRRRSRKGLDKKFECPQEGCGKSYSRAEHL
jgi:hypothetical protein